MRFLGILAHAENSPSSEHLGKKLSLKNIEKHTDIALKALVLVSVL